MNNTQEATIFPNKIRYHHMVIAVLIVLFALSLRFILIYQRAEGDVRFTPLDGTDHYNYVTNAQNVLEGTYPTEEFYYHPAPFYVFASIYRLIGNTNFVNLTFVIALIDALTCGVLIASAWLLTKRVWGGYLVGVLYATYPVAIFYATMPLIAPLAAFLISLFIFLTLWQGEKLSLWRTVLLGSVAGAIALHRLNLAPLVGLYIVYLLMLSITWRQRLLHSVLAVLMTIMVIAPITLYNYQASGGDFIPVAKTGSLEIYMGNNRDSAGRHSNTFAMQNIDMSYRDALIRDIQVAPEHFFGLLAYKFTLFWSRIETGNNISFDSVREATSLLDYLPMRFDWLMIIGLLGLAALWYQDRQSAVFLGLVVAWMCFGYVLVFAFGRIRFPVVIPMMLLSGYGIVSLYEAFLHGINWRQSIKRYTLPVITIVILMIFVNWALFPSPKLPPKRQYTELPSDATVLNIQFDDVTLVGWRTLDAWDFVRDGWIPVYESYAVELFWQINETSDIRYNFFIAYVDEGERYDAIDTPIGSVSFPEHTTDEWQVGEIYGEIISLRLDDDVPQGRSGQIRVGVWYWDDDGLIVNVPTSSGDANIALQPLAIFNHQVIPDIPELPEHHIVFGDEITLLGYDLPTTASISETIIIPFHWEALRNIERDYRLFLHVDNADGETITQGDNRPIPHLLTVNWLTNYPLHSELPLTLPDEAGTYSIYGGLYDEFGRLSPSVETVDNRVLLGEIIVE